MMAPIEMWQEKKRSISRFLVILFAIRSDRKLNVCTAPHDSALGKIQYRNSEDLSVPAAPLIKMRLGSVLVGLFALFSHQLSRYRKTFLCSVFTDCISCFQVCVMGPCFFVVFF